MKLDNTMAAIVTGGASGLGEATARMLAAEGVKVALFDRDAERGARVAGEIGGLFCAVDVTDEASVDAGFAKARAAHGTERVLVNCAGIAPGKRTVSKKRDTGEFVAHDVATFARTIQVNLIGTYQMIAKSAAAMAALEPITADGGRGVVVCTASVAATDGQIGQAAYAASKGGVLGLTLPVARDLSGYGIRVMTIMPGLFHTPMFESVPEDFRKTLEAGVPFPSRLGKPEEYAKLVRAIIDNDMLNGEAIRLDGALRMQPK
jgi:NAD(P)-dependent dehydrogenase (short-subunit alcohol dehydrogenase family)